jgi:hypothetical protein
VRLEFWKPLRSAQFFAGREVPVINEDFGEMRDNRTLEPELQIAVMLSPARPDSNIAHRH